VVDGGVSIKLDAPIFDRSTTPDTLYPQIEKNYPIVNGLLPIISGSDRGIVFPQTQTFNVTVKVTLYQNITSTIYYFLDGRYYDGLVHQYSDGFYYTGSVHSADAVRVDVVTKTDKVELDSFHTIIPNVAEVNYSDLLPSRISTDKLPVTIQQIAEVLVGTPQYLAALTDPKWFGTWDSNTIYSKNDEVFYAGSSWIYVNAISTSGQVPSTLNTDYWNLRASKGDPGGTGGTDTPYNASGWDGQLWTPTANVLRDKIETLASIASLANYAPLTNAALVTPTRTSNPLSSDDSLALATTNWIRSLFATLASPTFTGNPSAPTQAVTDASNKLATTLFVDSYAKARQFGLIVVEKQTITQTITSNTYNQINWNTETLDPYNSFASSVFTVPSDGWYKFTFLVLFTSTTTITSYELALFIGSTRLTPVSYQDNINAGFITLPCVITLFLTTGQLINTRLKAVSSGTITIFVGSDSISQLTIEKVTLY
jgi:hypothetical protein